MVMDVKGIMEVLNKSKRSLRTTSLSYVKAKTVIDQPRLRVTQGNFGWVKVRYTSPQGKDVTFNARPSFVREAIRSRQGSRYFTDAEAVYSAWIQNTRAGQLYTARRQVEGMVKTARIKGDEETAQALEKVLEGSDQQVAEFRQAWLDAHTDTEIEDFYKYEKELTFEDLMGELE